MFLFVRTPFTPHSRESKSSFKEMKHPSFSRQPNENPFAFQFLLLHQMVKCFHNKYNASAAGSDEDRGNCGFPESNNSGLGRRMTDRSSKSKVGERRSDSSDEGDEDSVPGDVVRVGSLCGQD